MTNINFLKPNKENLNLFLVLGALFFSLGIFDFCLNNFYGKNITVFLPGFISFFTPLIFGMIGLHLIRIEFSGIKFLDELNKNYLNKNQVFLIQKIKFQKLKINLDFLYLVLKNLHYSLLLFLYRNTFVVPIHK